MSSSSKSIHSEWKAPSALHLETAGEDVEQEDMKVRKVWIMLGLLFYTQPFMVFVDKKQSEPDNRKTNMNDVLFGRIHATFLN